MPSSFRQALLNAQYDSEEHADVIFLVGEEPDVQRIPAHSWVLVDKSPVFRAMFKGPLAEGQTTSQPVQPAAGSNRGRRRRTSSGTSFDKYAASSSLGTIQDNEDLEPTSTAGLLPSASAADLVGKPIEFEVKASISDYDDEKSRQIGTPIPTIVVQDLTISEAGDLEADRSFDIDIADDMSAKSLGVQPSSIAATPVAAAAACNSSSLNKATIAVSDVDGRAFDILLR